MPKFNDISQSLVGDYAIAMATIFTSKRTQNPRICIQNTYSSPALLLELEKPL